MAREGNQVEHAVQLAGGVEALATVLGASRATLERWLAGHEEVPRTTSRRLSRMISQAQNAAARVKLVSDPPARDR